MSDKYSILVIGDLILDKTQYVDVRRKNPEAPTIAAELLPSNQPLLTLGGAGLPACIAAAQGHDVTLFSCLSPRAEEIIENSDLNIDQTLRLSLEVDLNITKTRFIDNQQGYHLLRLDNDRLVENPWQNIDRPPHKEALSRLTRLMADGVEFDICLISDYAKGFFAEKGWEQLLELLHTRRIISLLDSKSDALFPWRSLFVDHDIWFKLNDKEFKQFSKTIASSYRSPDPKMIVQDLDITRHLLITHGKDGASLYSNNNDGKAVNHVKKLPKVKQPNIADPTGCGDVFDITFLIQLRSGASPAEALQKAVNSATEFAKISMRRKLS